MLKPVEWRFVRVSTTTTIGLVAIIGATWPALHALFHIWIWISRGFPLDHVASSNLTAIQLPAWLALAAALNFARKEAAR